MLRVQAQLQAGFTIDKSSGCSPLEVKFTNTTTGASASVKYSWDFGNGNSSTLVDPQATYGLEQVYTVTLTATDGAAVSKVKRDITVYKKPKLSFNASPLVGCAPFKVDFTSTADPGDGTISQYLWDFGDGNTLAGSNLSKISHTYTVGQTPPVNLTVTNSYGCYNTASKSNFIEVYKPLIAAFTPSASVLCTTGQEVTFSNKSSGGGNLSYFWDFGDGTSTTVRSPKHTFKTKGTFTVKLTVKNSEGCPDAVASADINVADIATDFTVPASLCTFSFYTFSNKSTKPYDRVVWTIDNNPEVGEGNGDLRYRFTVPGVYKVALTAYYGKCSFSVVKSVTVGRVPNLNGFVAEMTSACALPVTISFRDTTNEAVRWAWRNNNARDVFDSVKNTSYTFTTGTSDNISLTIVNSDGCAKTVTKTVALDKPDVSIVIKKSSSPGLSKDRGCPGLDITFGTDPANLIQSFSWDFGDGTTSNLPQPQHVFNNLGQYSVSLDFVTKSGCAAKIQYDSIYISEVPAFDFTVSPGQLICGNSPVTFIPTIAPNCDYIWLINGAEAFQSSTPDPFVYRFNYDTVYTISLVLQSGSCSDTLTKVDYVTVVPPFPEIKHVVHTCEGNRGLVKLVDSSRKAMQWNWDFGDNTSEISTSFRDTIQHEYSATGTYKVTLTTSNGPCTLSDSVNVHVLLKQSPLFSADKTIICTADSAMVTLNNLEANPADTGGQHYSILKFEYGDLTTSTATLKADAWTNSVTGMLMGLETGKEQVRVVTQSAYFGCEDTSNFANLKVIGPMAALAYNPIVCLADTLMMFDKSVANPGSPIVKWDWFVDDSTAISTASGGSFAYKYARPGNYFISLRVTDSDGCESKTTSPDNNYLLKLTGPVAAFSASAYTVLTNTTVDFVNESTFLSGSSVVWDFENGHSSTEDNPSYTFTNEGSFNVLLIASNRSSGCIDTAQATITVNKVKSIFNADITYIDSNHCPPVIVNFKSQSEYTETVRWNFGDGGEAGNEKEVEHIFTDPGTYRVTHYSYDANGNIDSTSQYFTVKGPYAYLKADTLFGCQMIKVTLTADTVNAVSFKWDFGDGIIKETKDTFATHVYPTAGIYTPALILVDREGCSVTSRLTQQIIVDSLNASFASNPPGHLCDSGYVAFTPAVKSLAADTSGASLRFNWTSSLYPKDTTHNQTASINFNKPGIHKVFLAVSTPYGCKASASQQVEVKVSPKAAITGPGKICRYDSVSFLGSSKPATGIASWEWQMGDGTVSSLQNPQPVKYNTPGLANVSLVINDSYCSDTTVFSLDIRNTPDVKLALAKTFTCKGDSVNLTATGNGACVWTPATNILNANASSTMVWPASDRFYTAKITNTDGCSTKDSIEVKVVQPFAMQVKSPLFTCLGGPVQFEASGAASYEWLNPGIADRTKANPVTVPMASSVYSVVGFDSYQCFTDTAYVNVNVGALPTVNAGPDQKIIAGNPVTLNTANSANVTKWKWSPAEYLQCTNCPAPVCTPKKAMEYIVTATTSEGCVAYDTVRVEMICGSDLVYIPTAFTPNGDNLNDRFSVQGSGISIRRLAIFDRWGKMVFERKNISAHDTNSSWDGRFNGQLLPSGAYVYVFDARCDSGDEFSYQGTITLIR